MPPRYETKVFRKESNSSELTAEQLLPVVIELQTLDSNLIENEITPETKVKHYSTLNPCKQTRTCQILTLIAVLFTIFVGGIFVYVQLNMKSPEFGEGTIYFPTVTTPTTNLTSTEISTTENFNQDNSTTNIFPSTVSDKETSTTTTTGKTTTPFTTTTKTVTTTSYKDPIIFLFEEYTYLDAVGACKDLGLKLATKSDMLKAFEAGYERCEYGWLRNMHTGYVMQKSGARLSCGGGVVGLIYSSYKSPDVIVKGAYCSTKVPENALISNNDNSNNNSVNWWTTLDAADVINLKQLLAETGNTLTRSMRAIYPCCNYLNIDSNELENVSFVWQKMSSAYMETLANIYREELGLPNLKVFPHLTANYDAMMNYGAATTNRTKIIEDITSRANEAKVDGVIVDYEPTKQYTKEHAIIYRDFLNALSSEMKKFGMKVGMTIAAWGILKEYELYAESECEIIGSMSNTYYGNDVDYNIDQVKKMLSYISTERLQIGIGAMHDISKPNSMDYNWTAENLLKFVDWLKSNDVTQLYVYPGDWSNIKNIEDYFISALNEFIK